MSIGAFGVSFGIRLALFLNSFSLLRTLYRFTQIAIAPSGRLPGSGRTRRGHRLGLGWLHLQTKKRGGLLDGFDGCVWRGAVAVAVGGVCKASPCRNDSQLFFAIFSARIDVAGGHTAGAVEPPRFNVKALPTPPGKRRPLPANLGDSGFILGLFGISCGIGFIMLHRAILLSLRQAHYKSASLCSIRRMRLGR